MRVGDGEDRMFITRMMETFVDRMLHRLFLQSPSGPDHANNSMRSSTSTSLLAIQAAASAVVAQKCEHQWTGPFSESEIDAVLQSRQDTPPPPLEIRPLIVSGDSANRVDLIFFGDGCKREGRAVDLKRGDRRY